MTYRNLKNTRIVVPNKQSIFKKSMYDMLQKNEDIFQ